MKTKNGANYNIHRYMFRTYLIIVAIAIILECIVFIYMLLNSNNYMKATHEAQLKKIQYQIDTNMDNVITQTNSLSQNIDVRNILGIRFQKTYFGEDVKSVKKMMDIFSNAMSFYKEISSISLIDNQQNVLINQSGIYHDEKYLTYLQHQMGIDRDIYKEILKKSTDPLILIHPGTLDCRLYYVQKIYIRSYQEPDGILLTEISMDYFEETLNAYNEGENKLYLLSDKNGNCIGYNEVEKNILSKIHSQGKNYGNITFDKKTYAYTSMYSEASCFTYYYLEYYYQFYHIIAVTLIFVGVNLIVLVLVSLYLSRHFALKHSRPLRQIMELLKKQEEEDFTYEQMISGVSGLNVRLKGLEDSRKKEYFSLIFTGQEREEANILEFQKQYEAKLSKGFYILGIHIQNLSEHSDHDVLLFCINNIFGELLEDSLIGVPVEMWDKVYFLIQKNGADTGKKITAGMEFLEGRLSMTVCAGISSVKYSFLDIRNAKWEADCMVEYAGLAGINYIPMKYSEIMEQDDLKKGSLQASLKKLINLVLVKDYEKCRELLKELYEGQDVKKYSSIRESRQQMLTFLSFITIPYQEKTGKMNYDSLQDKGMEELYQFSMEILEALTVKEEPDKPGSGIFEEIVSYIQEHIGDPNLSAGEISEKFHITPSYISRIFKRETGEGALDYIHRARIRRGKEMLKEGKTVQEAALSLGYIDARGFIRAFKRYEGITPGQYKGM